MFINIYHLIKENVKTKTKMIFNDHMKEFNKTLTAFIRVRNRYEFFHKFNNVEIILLIHQKLNMIC